MKRVPFSQVLKNASIDLRREYDRLYGLFYLQKFQDAVGTGYSLREWCASSFQRFPFRGTCISLDDFDDFYGYSFEKNPSDFELDYLVSFCEYSYNLAMYSQDAIFGGGIVGFGSPMQYYFQQVLRVIETIGYMPNNQNGTTDFVPKDQAAVAVAEIIDPNLSYRVIEYNHHSMKGDLERKRTILLSLADKLEPQRSKLKNINPSLEDSLFFLFNNVNIRHNNADPEGKKHIAFVASLGKDEIERWYDDTYEMCLIAFLELDNVDRKARVKQLREDIQNNK